MTETSQFSNVTKSYLSRYYEILDEMIRAMECASQNESISHNFITQMLPHHKAAIELSKALLQYTTLVPLQAIAENIITEQTKSIEQMQAALEACTLAENTEEDLALYQRRNETILRAMFTNMGNTRVSNNVNADYMREMIPHHKGAIQMAENAFCYPICPELKPILRAIILSQRAGVAELERLLRCVPDN